MTLDESQSERLAKDCERALRDILNSDGYCGKKANKHFCDDAISTGSRVVTRDFARMTNRTGFYETRCCAESEKTTRLPTFDTWAATNGFGYDADHKTQERGGETGFE